MHRPGTFILFLRTTAIGGLLFLLPLIVLGALIGQVAPVVMAIAETLREILPFRTPGGIALLVLLAIGLLVLLCFVAGLIANWSLSRRISEAFEEKLLLLFPRYAILKDRMADTIGGDKTKPKMKPVVVRFDDHQRIGFEVERSEVNRIVAVYLPGSPDAWSGRVVLVEADRLTPLPADFGVAVATCEQLGRGSTNFLSAQGEASGKAGA